MVKGLINFFDGKKTRRYIPLKRRKIIYKRDFGCCRYCGKPVRFSKFHADHIEPVSYGGNDYVFNLATAHKKCNLKRSNKWWIKPKKLNLLQKVYQLILIVVYRDIPSIKDYI